MKATYNGSKWTLAGTHKYSPKYQYFAYYPYSTSGLGHVTGTVASGTTAATFFASGISSFSVKTNQSTAANINASDLQVGKATISRTTASDISFAMSHAMGLASITIGSKSVSTTTPTITTTSYTLAENRLVATYTFDAKVRTTNTTTSTVTASTTFSGNTPYKKSSTLYGFVMKPATSTSFAGTGTDSWSLSTQAAAGAVAKSTVQSSRTSVTNATQYKTVTGQTFTLAVGDTYYSDGSISHPGTQNYGTTPIGLVVKISSANVKNEENDYTVECLPGKNENIGGHGLVMCLRDYGVTGSSITPTTKGTKLQTSTNNNNVYTVTADGAWSTYEIASSYFKWYYDIGTVLNNANYPAIYYAAHYSTLTAPSKSTGWFLPSIGQWRVLYSSSGYATVSDLDDALATAAHGTGYTELHNSTYYASITPHSINGSKGYYVAKFYDSATNKFTMSYTAESYTESHYVRPFLAF